MAEELLSSELGKETVVRGQQSQKLDRSTSLHSCGEDKRVQVTAAHGQFPRPLEACACEGLGSGARWCMGKNVAIAFPDTYQEPLFPSPQQFPAMLNNVRTHEAAWEAPTVGRCRHMREKNGKHAVPLARVTVAGSWGWGAGGGQGGRRWTSRCDPVEETVRCGVKRSSAGSQAPLPQVSSHCLCSAHSDGCCAFDGLG